MADPESEWAKYSNHKVESYDEISRFDCLVLLGEPGIGKSTAIRQATENGASGKLFKNLRSYSSEQRLMNQIFGDPAFTSWEQGTGTLELFLDSLDECLLRVATVTALLSDELAARRPLLPRLRLRVACRTAEWPGAFEQSLRELWGKDRVAVYELAPLRRCDVAEAADAYGVNPDNFFPAVSRARAVPFAIKPVTLHFLLGQYRQTQALPPSQADLYEGGCRLLAAETSDDRRTARALGQLSTDQRVALARRIAALMMFCNRSSIFTGVGVAEPGEISIGEIVGGQERALGNLFAVDESAVREVLDTGLFTSRGGQRLGWSHQTYAEYLAASYMANAAFPLAQAKDLVFANTDGEKRVIPQLQETAGWIAGLSADVREAILKADPQVLLRSDVASATEELRSSLVGALLERFDAVEIVDSDWALHNSYRHLKHPGLADQLRPYIEDRSKGFLVRRFAIDVAEACGEVTLEGSLLNVSLDATDDSHVRYQAAYAVSQIGTDPAKRGLRPILKEQPNGSDAEADDRLKACALRALWPKLLPASELFELLPEPDNGGHRNDFHRFLDTSLVEGLARADLPVALEWAGKQTFVHNALQTFTRLVGEIVAKAWDAYDDDLAPLIARVVARRIREHGHLVRQTSVLSEEPLWNDEDPRRRKLLLTILELDPAALGLKVGSLAYSHPRLVVSDDIPWLVEQLRSAGPPRVRKDILDLIELLFNFGVEQLGAILNALGLPEMNERFAPRFRPITIGSPEAKEARRLLAAQKRMERSWRRRPAPLLKPSPRERVHGLLVFCESEHPDAWWQLPRELTLEERSTHYGSSTEGDIRELPGWKKVDEPTRARIVATAKAYLHAGDPKPDEWIGSNDVFLPAEAGYQALLLIMNEDPGYLPSLGAGIWGKWVPAVLTHSSNDHEERQAVVAKAYQEVPDALINFLLRLIDAENAAGQHLFSLTSVDKCWDERLMSAVDDKVPDATLKPQVMRQLLDELLIRKSAKAREFARTLITVPPPAEGPQRERAQLAAIELWTYGPGEEVSHLLSAVRADSDWGKSVVTSVANARGFRRGDDFFKGVSEPTLAELYAWLAEHFPDQVERREAPGELPTVTNTQIVRGFRESVLSALRDRGTPASVAAIHRLMEQLPDRTHLQWVLIHARDAMLRRTWSPPTPASVLRLRNNADARLVESGEQLLEVIVGSLARLEANFHGITGTAFTAWDRQRDETWRPKEEERLSDIIAQHLRNDLQGRGVVANREVVIRARMGADGAPGERTDVHVNAVQAGTNDVITVIVEVKGCWHAEVLTAIRTQLVERYMTQSPCRHGLYVVGWFICPLWNDSNDSRRRRIPASSMTELASRIHESAKELTTGGRTVQALVMDCRLR